MTQTVANTAVTNTFDYWRNRTNELAYAMSTYAVTVGGSTAAGNAAISGSFAYGAGQLWAANTVTTGTSAQVIDSFPVGYRTAEYILSVNDNNANKHYASKALIMHDRGNAYISEYATLTSNSAMGSFTATTNSTSVILSFTPVSSNTTVNFNRILVSA